MSESQQNIQMDVSENTSQASQQASQSAPQAASQAEPSINLTDVEVKDENIALNLFVSFLNLAQRRGAYNMQESAKIWECISKFQR
jgi:hypothetical protein